MKRAPRELLPHEQVLVEQGELLDIAHSGAKHIIFGAHLGVVPNANRVCVYRHMGDAELLYLLQNKQLPDTQPYQTIVRGEEGFNYCKKYFGGGKRVDSNVTCIVEFECEEKMVADLFSRFSKAEDGCMSTGLGHKAGKTLSIFNDCLKRGETTFRIVFVRRLKKGK